MKNLNIPQCETCDCKSRSAFKACNTEEVSALNDSKSCNFYKKGQFVFSEGALPIGMFCINSGLIKLVKQSSGGKEMIIRVAKPGDIIGYRSLMVGHRYTSTAVAMQDATICLVPKDVFEKMIAESPRFHKEVLERLCRSMEEAENNLSDLAYKPVRGRIADALLLLCNSLNSQGEIDITREELAGMAGTVKETAIRIVSEFKSDQLIDINKRKIKVLSSEGLANVSKLYD